MRPVINVIAAASLGLLAASAQADEFGRVIASTPIVQQVAVPDQTCAPGSGRATGGGAALGTLIGAVVGHGISSGGGSGRAVATGIGAVAGAVIGHSVESSNRGPSNCSTQTRYENRTVGYQVTYEYAGRQYTTQMAQDPGPTVRLQIQPVGAATMGSAAVPAPSAAAVPQTYIAPVVTTPNVTAVVPAPVVVSSGYVYPVVAPSVVAAPTYTYIVAPGHRHWHHRHHAHRGDMMVASVVHPVPARPYRHWD